jgi:hypothetical protein
VSRDGGMTTQARSYLLAAFARHLGLGVLCVVVLPGYHLESVRYVSHPVPLAAWGALFLAVALVALAAVTASCDLLAQAALTGSALMSAAWCAAFGLAAGHGETSAPVVAILLGSLCWKDLTIASQPLRRSPLRDLAATLAHDPRAGDEWTSRES